MKTIGFFTILIFADPASFSGLISAKFCENIKVVRASSDVTGFWLDPV